jgi:predicted dehydrogenase
VVRSLAGTQISVLAAAGVGNHQRSGADHVTALLDLGNDAVATLTASRITQNTVRRIAITTDAGLIDVDYSNQSVEIFTQDRVKPPGPATQFGDYALDIAMERVQVRRTEPLQVELAHFIEVIQRDADPLVSGKDGLEALRLVWMIRDRLDQHHRCKVAAE